MNADLFSFQNYKDFIRAQINREGQERGYQARLALQAGCQRSFLSQVLNGDLHLQREHGAELARFWELDEGESEYFIGLIDLARAGTPHLKRLILGRLAQIKETRENLTQRIRGKDFGDLEIGATYYSSWYWTAIHIAVSVPAFRTATALAKRLALPVELVRATLKRLEELGIVKREGQGWNIGPRDVHVPADSPFNEANHANWRYRAIQNIQLNHKDATHYTAVFTMSRADANKLQRTLTDTLVEARRLIAPSPEEELYCLSADFFRV